MLPSTTSSVMVVAPPPSVSVAATSTCARIMRRSQHNTETHIIITKRWGGQLYHFSCVSSRPPRHRSAPHPCTHTYIYTHVPCRREVQVQTSSSHFSCFTAASSSSQTPLSLSHTHVVLLPPSSSVSFFFPSTHVRPHTTRVFHKRSSSSSFPFPFLWRSSYNTHTHTHTHSVCLSLSLFCHRRTKRAVDRLDGRGNKKNRMGHF